MSLSSYLHDRLRLMAPDESITLTRESLQWILATHDSGAADPMEAVERPIVQRVAPAFQTVEDLAVIDKEVVHRT